MGETCSMRASLRMWDWYVVTVSNIFVKINEREIKANSMNKTYVFYNTQDIVDFSTLDLINKYVWEYLNALI